MTGNYWAVGGAIFLLASVATVMSGPLAGFSVVAGFTLVQGIRHWRD